MGNTDTNRRRPDDVANDAVLQLAPPLLDVHEESLQRVDLGDCLGQLVLSLCELARRLLSVVATSLHPPRQCPSPFLRGVNSIVQGTDIGLDRSEVVGERGVSYDDDLLLRCGFLGVVSELPSTSQVEKNVPT